MLQRWRHGWGDDPYTPLWEVGLWTDRKTWLLGVQVYAYPSEWILWVHVGPVAFTLQRIR